MHTMKIFINIHKHKCNNNNKITKNYLTVNIINKQMKK